MRGAKCLVSARIVAGVESEVLLLNIKENSSESAGNFDPVAISLRGRSTIGRAMALLAVSPSSRKFVPIRPPASSIPPSLSLSTLNDSNVAKVKTGRGAGRFDRVLLEREVGGKARYERGNSTGQMNFHDIVN